MNTEQLLHNPVSIRQTYLTRRAELIREHLEVDQDSIPQFIGQICADDFNATRDEVLFARCLEWMHANIHTKCSIRSLAREQKLSVRKVQRLFAFFAKKSYTDFLLKMRIETAKKYLSELKYNVGEVGYLVGVKDHAYFTYLFRKTTGQTPSLFRLSLMTAQMNQAKNSTNVS